MFEVCRVRNDDSNEDGDPDVHDPCGCYFLKGDKREVDGKYAFLESCVALPGNAWGLRQCCHAAWTMFHLLSSTRFDIFDTFRPQLQIALKAFRVCINKNITVLALSSRPCFAVDPPK